MQKRPGSLTWPLPFFEKVELEAPHLHFGLKFNPEFFFHARLHIGNELAYVDSSGTPGINHEPRVLF